MVWIWSIFVSFHSWMNHCLAAFWGSGGRIGSAIQKIYPLIDGSKWILDALEDFPVTLVGEVVSFSRSWMFQVNDDDYFPAEKSQTDFVVCISMGPTEITKMLFCHSGNSRKFFGITFQWYIFNDLGNSTMVSKKHYSSLGAIWSDKGSRFCLWNATPFWFEEELWQWEYPSIHPLNTPHIVWIYVLWPASVVESETNSTAAYESCCF